MNKISLRDPKQSKIKIGPALGPQKVKGTDSNVTGKKPTILRQSKPKWSGK